MSNVANPRQRSNPLAVTIAILVGLFVTFSVVAGFWTDWQWYVSVGRSDVFTTQIKIKVVLFVAFALITWLAVWAGAHFAYRNRPKLIPTTQCCH